VQEERLTKEGRHNLHKQARDKRGIAESLHPYINRTRQIACEWAYFSKEIWQLSKISLFEELLKFVTHGCIFERIWYIPGNNQTGDIPMF